MIVDTVLLIALLAIMVLITIGFVKKVEVQNVCAILYCILLGLMVFVIELAADIK